MNKKNEEIRMINIQLAVSLALSIVFLYSFLVNYNNKLSLAGKMPFWSSKKTHDIALTLRIIVIITAIASFYTAVKNKEIIERNNLISKDDLDIASTEILATVIAIVVAFMNLHVAKRRGPNETEFEEIIP